MMLLESISAWCTSSIWFCCVINHVNRFAVQSPWWFDKRVWTSFRGTASCARLFCLCAILCFALHKLDPYVMFCQLRVVRR